MEECFRCGVSRDKALLFDAVSKEGIVKICKKCSEEEEIPLITKPQHLQFMDEKPLSIRERLSKMAKLKPKVEGVKKSAELKNQEFSIKNIMERNAEKKVMEGAYSGEGLVKNFHWIIMRARRAKHITQKQLAESIEEPESVIKLAERGIISKENPRLMRKIQNALGVKLIGDESFFPNTDRARNVLDLKKDSPKELTIADLRAIKFRREEEMRKKGTEESSEDFLEIEESGFNISGNSGEIEENSEKNNSFQHRKTSKGDLSPDEINELLFKKRAEKGR